MEVKPISRGRAELELSELTNPNDVLILGPIEVHSVLNWLDEKGFLTLSPEREFEEHFRQLVRINKHSIPVKAVEKLFDMAIQIIDSKEAKS